MKRVISFGLGVQSVTMSRMALRGLLGPIPDAAVFADPQFESAGTYAMLAVMQAEFAEAGVPFYHVTAGNIKTALLAEGGQFAPIPVYTKNESGDGAILRRQCTNEYKLAPLRRQERLIAGLKPGQRTPTPLIERWIGISLDEVQRMKNSRDAYAVNVYPLVDANMSRHDCLQWLRRNGYDAPPKSSCLCCPYHDDAYWRAMKAERPEEWEQAVEVDEAVRRGLHNVKCEGYLHRSLTPLKMVDFSTAEDKGQVRLWDAFSEECEGMCGL